MAAAGGSWETPATTLMWLGCGIFNERLISNFYIRQSPILEIFFASNFPITVVLKFMKLTFISMKQTHCLN